GYIDRKDGTTGAITPNFNDSSQLVVRGQLRYENDGGDLQVVPSIFYQKTTTQGSGESDAGNANLVTRYTDEPLRDEIFAPSLTIRKNFGGYALTSATTYLKRSFYTATDYTISALGNELYGLVTPVSMALPTQISQVSEEMRLVSPKANGVDRKFEWILGVYFEHSDTHVANYLTAEENQTSLYDRLAAAYGADTADALTASGSNVYSQISTQSTTQFSGFGELSFKPNRRITATVGFRALTAHQSALTLTNGLIGTGSNSWSSDSSSLNSSAFTPKFSLRYELSRDANIYATAVKGFRLGGINQSVPTSTCGSALGQLGLTKAPMTYKPDSVWSYEGGFKGSLLHHRLDVAGAVYLIDWNGVQQTVNLQTYDNACPYTYVGNVGRARVMGTDLEFSAHLTRTLTLRANGGYTQAEIRTDNESTGTYRGEWLLGVPRWTGAAGFSYNGRADERTRLFGALDVHLIGPSRASFSASDVGYRRSPYATLDGSFGVDMAGTRVSLFAKNITNSRKITQQETASPYLVRALAPRTIGLSVQKSF
ncbi:MAG TPA: TonB-dependent receptor, partial [Novosphingobium sp.]|nr:TonB-dependent receptor [Novosphingobium sp.]